ncbi:MAG: hypothetical protein WA364_14850 [Candidatus Nitrosopolaris sp.]
MSISRFMSELDYRDKLKKIFWDMSDSLPATKDIIITRPSQGKETSPGL